MKLKRVGIALLAFIIYFSSSIQAYACDDSQSRSRVSEILFGDEALVYESDDNAKMLFDAIYLCCEQTGNQGQDKLNYLKKKKVSRIPSLDSIKVNNQSLWTSSHIRWEDEFSKNNDARNNRKRILQNTVNKVFGLGSIHSLFGNKKGKGNSLAALLYYSHILSDYLADDPEDTEINIKGKTVPAYCGEPSFSINGGRPSFTPSQKRSTESIATYSLLDNLGRCGVAYAVLGEDIMPPPNSRQNIGAIKPSGWSQNKYQGIVNSEPAYIYNRCHLIAHQLAGNDTNNNLITGTRYLNEEGMKPYEDKVADYIRKTNNHVLYRATPVYKGDNKIASGVIIEAYSVEDEGEGISINEYCYNVQPGIDINYASGKNELNDKVYNSNAVIQFAVSNPSEDNPDLIYEMNKHLKVLFGNEEGINKELYLSLTNEINSIAYEARSVGRVNEKPAQTYAKMKKCEYEYYQVLKLYIPQMLKNEDYFSSVFN